MGAVSGTKRSRLYPTGEDHPRWKGGEREKICEQCGKVFRHTPPTTFATFKKRKFCSRECSRKGQKRLTGQDHPNYKPDSRRKNRRGKHGAWARAVISRDLATCQHCGATDKALHAHHIKPFSTYPHLRWEIENGITLCYLCHEAVHAALNANGVNSGNILAGNAEDNPEPSFGRKPIEGVTTRGRAYRRWNGACDWCGTFISKPWSDVKGKKHLYCSKVCMGKGHARNRGFNVRQ